jgi:hypothetical protein
MEQLHDAAAIFRSHLNYAAPERVTAAVIDLLNHHRFRLLDEAELPASPLR